jgi:hypothetical protein
MAITVLGAGLSLIKFHGGIWPWWFHGVAVALITCSITTPVVFLHVREVSRREARRLIGEHMSHEVCTALQILVQCTYLHPLERVQLESEAIERLRVAAREILPTLLDIPASTRPFPSRPVREDGNRKTMAAGAE